MEDSRKDEIFHKEEVKRFDQCGRKGIFQYYFFYFFFKRVFLSKCHFYLCQLVGNIFFFPLVFPAEMLETSKTRLRDQEKYLAYGSEKYATCTLQCDKLMCDLNSMNLIFE